MSRKPVDRPVGRDSYISPYGYNFNSLDPYGYISSDEVNRLIDFDIHHSPQDFDMDHSPLDIDIHHSTPDLVTHNAPQDLVLHHAPPDLVLHHAPPDLDLHAPPDLDLHHAPPDLDLYHSLLDLNLYPSPPDLDLHHSLQDSDIHYSLQNLKCEPIEYLATSKERSWSISKEQLFIMVDPRTCSSIEPDIPKPYNPFQDHDYCKEAEMIEVINVSQSNPLQEIKKEIECKDVNDPVVEVWEIDNFNSKESSPIVPNQLPGYSQNFKRETRRTSTRTADIKRREQARKISSAVQAALKTSRVQRTKQYKRIQPKNSVETTPSQSDIEEWYCQPARQIPSKETQRKKKTSKGRIDHSESERHRRTVLKENFSCLCGLIPHVYLQGEKVSSQISKQKILNGAKAYILALHSKQSCYRSLFKKNKLFRQLFQKLNKRVKKHN